MSAAIGKPKAKGKHWQGTITSSGDRMEKRKPWEKPGGQFSSGQQV